MNRRLTLKIVFVGTIFVMAACGGAARSTPPLPATEPATSISAGNDVVYPDEPSRTTTYEGRGTSSSVRESVEISRGQLYALLDFDDIFPVYDPTFVSAAAASISDRHLVIGLAINGESRAYSVDTLNHREMVNDVVGGIPVLVTW